jgi:hypothetical protein
MYDEVLIPIFAIIGVFFAAPAAVVLIVWMTLKTRAKEKEQRYAERMAMIQQGILPLTEAEAIKSLEKEKKVRWTTEEELSVLPKDPERRLLRGVTTGAVGAALTIYAFIIESEFWLIAGLIPLVIGVTIIPKKMLTRGIATTVIGLIVTLYMIIDLDTTWLLAGLILLFIGLSRIVIHFMVERREKEGAVGATPAEETADIV